MTNKDPRQEISPRQSASIIASTMIGAGVLTLPRTVAEYAKQSGWFAVILGMIIAMAGVSIMTLLSNKFPRQNIIEYSQEILGSRKYKAVGRWLSYPLLLPILGYWCVVTVLASRLFGEVVVTAVLPATPLEVIISTMLLIAYVLTFYSVEVVARVNELLLPLIVVPVLLISLSSYQHARLYHLFPLRYDVDWSDLFMGAFSAFAFPFLGFEVLLLFAKYSRHPSVLLRDHVAAVALPGFIYTLIAVAGMAVFGVDELKRLMWPTYELVKVTKVPGLILERVESAFIGVWVAAVFTTTANIYYAICMFIREMLGMKGHRIIATILLPLFYWISLRPPNIQALINYLTYSGCAGGIAILVIPTLLLGVSYLRKKGGKGAAHDA